ncbi:uncharacterized protein N7469_003138 [Penicillium citrinum]|uniref:Uncharacterized protein n=1 Tax=Penicillium citrinum TaxID=5077 RepID=A0A9W9PBV1_PENCI|nr:uncharacterized protein N7469_003138 [Penicillium citrinum]KAJ5241547.1 hypothetical protein N7469_003138 [Penicillium citrinum]
MSEPKTFYFHQPAPSGRAVTRLTHLPWSSGHDFRLSLTPISAGDRGSIPRGRVSFCLFFFVQKVAGDSIFFLKIVINASKNNYVYNSCSIIK